MQLLFTLSRFIWLWAARTPLSRYTPPRRQRRKGDRRKMSPRCTFLQLVNLLWLTRLVSSSCCVAMHNNDINRKLLTGCGSDENSLDKTWLIEPTGCPWSSTNSKRSVQSCFVLCWANRDPTHCFTFEPKCFYWLVVHMHFNTICVCAESIQTNKGDGEQEPITKKLAEFHNQFVLLTVVWNWWK